MADKRWESLTTDEKADVLYANLKRLGELVNQLGFQIDDMNKKITALQKDQKRKAE